MARKRKQLSSEEVESAVDDSFTNIIDNVAGLGNDQEKKEVLREIVLRINDFIESDLDEDEEEDDDDDEGDDLDEE